MWWLTYLRSGKMAGVVVIEAPSLIAARMRAALEAVEAGVDFAEGHEIDAARSVWCQRSSSSGCCQSRKPTGF